MTISSIKRKDFWRSCNALYRRHWLGQFPIGLLVCPWGRGLCTSTYDYVTSCLYYTFDYNINAWLYDMSFETLTTDYDCGWYFLDIKPTYPPSYYFGNLRMGELFPFHQKWMPWGTKGHFLDGGNNSPIIHPSTPPYLGWSWVMLVRALRRLARSSTDSRQ